MRNDKVKSTDGEKTPSPKAEIDYKPKTYTLREQIILGVKFVSCAGIFCLMLLLFKYLTLWFFK